MPSVEVRAVPDATTMQRLAKALAEPAATSRPEPDVQSAIEQLDRALRASWPNDAAGKLLGWSLEHSSPAVVRVEHLGAGLDEAAMDLLTRGVVAATGLPLTIRDLAAPREPVDAPRGEGRAWLVRALPLLRVFKGNTQRLFLCIDMPDANEADIGSVRSLVQTELFGVPDSRVDIRTAEGWSATLAESACRAVLEGAAGAPSDPR